MINRNILIINANTNVVYSPITPLGLGYLIQAIGTEFNCEFVDLAYYKNIDQALSKFNLNVFSIIFMSLRNYDNSDYFNYHCYIDEYKEVINYIRNRSNAIILLGGSIFLVDSIDIYNIDADYFLIGYWEDRIKNLCLDILYNNLEKILSYKNLYIKEKNRIIREKMINDFTCLPNRDFFETSFLSQGDLGNIEFSRGCTQKCAYCVIPYNFSNCTYKSVELIKLELLEMKEKNIKKIFIVDNLINLNITKLKEICKMIINEGLYFEFTCQFHPKFWDEELLNLMKKANIINLELSLTSYSDRMLKTMRKGFNTMDIDLCIKNLRKHNFNIYIDFTVGCLNEEFEDTLKTIEYYKTNNNVNISINIYIGFRLFKNTLLYELVEEDYKDNKFYFSPYLKEHFQDIMNLIETKSNYQNTKLYNLLLYKFKDYKARKNFIDNFMMLKKGDDENG